MTRLSQMKITSKRKAGVLELLNSFETEHTSQPGRNISLDIFMRYFFLRNKAVYDSEARNQIVDLTYTLMRYKGYLNAIASRRQSGQADHVTWAARLKAFETPDFADLFDSNSIPIHARCSVPYDLYKVLCSNYSEEEVIKICRAYLEPPKLTIRANTLKTTRDELLKVLTKEHNFKVEECKHAPNGIRFV